jgi:hypothetical protein
MKIRFDQSGGFLGIVKGYEVDTSALPADEAQVLEQLVKTSGITASGEFFSNSGRDLFQYEITIKDGASNVSAVFDDETIPPSAKQLIGYMKKRSKPKAPDS